MPLIKNINQVCVIEKGTLSGVILTGDYNLVGATYKATLQNLVNRVLITDNKGNVIKTVEDGESVKKYGLVQKIIKQSEKEDATPEAQKALVTVESSATVSASPSDFRAVSGYSVIVQESDTGLYGKFYIESDSHTFENGKSQMELTLSFENLMDEKELEEAKLENRRDLDDGSKYCANGTRTGKETRTKNQFRKFHPGQCGWDFSGGGGINKSRIHPPSGADGVQRVPESGAELTGRRHSKAL